MKSVFVLIAGFIFMSCNDHLRLEDEGYIIFGVYNGFCVIDCTDLYKIKDGQVYGETNDYFTSLEELKFSDDPLVESSYLKAKVVVDDFPDKLLDEKENVFGCPGCHDQDIVLVVYNDGSETWEWTLDTDQNAIPAYLETYVQLIKETVAELKG